MANDFSSFMNKVAAIAMLVVREEFGMLKRLQHDFDTAAARKGSSFSIPLPVPLTATNVTPGATPPAQTSVTVPTVPITLDQWKMVPFSLTTKESMEIDAGKQYIPQQMAEAIRGLLREINAHVLSKYKRIYGFAGTAGTNPFNANTEPVADVDKVLNDQLCPHGNRHLGISNAARQAALKLPDFKQVNYRGDNQALTKGVLGELFGFNIYNDSQMPTHASTALTAGELTVNGVNALGAKVVSLAKATNAAPLVAGDIITISGQTYAVQADVNLIVGNTNVSIEPGLKAATAGGEAVTLKATHVVNIAYDPAAFGLVIRPLAFDQIEGAPVLGKSIIMTDPETGVSFKLTYLPGFESATWYVSAVYGAECISPERAARLAG